jgi:CAAX protease family protein
MDDQAGSGGWRPATHGSAFPGPAPYVYPQQPYQPAARRPWIQAPPPGTPYHRLARTPAQRWWQAVAGTLAIVAAGLVVVAGGLLAGTIAWYTLTGRELPVLTGPTPSGDLLFSDETADLAFALGVIAVYLPIVLLAALVFQRRRPGTLSSVVGRLRWRWLLTCFGLAAATCLVSYGLSVLVSGLVDDPGEQVEWVGWSRFAVPALVILVLVPLQSAAEEYFFRGWLLQSIAGCTLETRSGRLARRLSVMFRTPWPAIVISAIVFVFSHGYTGWGMVDVFGFAVVSGWLAVRTGGLESSIAIHVANNLVAFGFSAAAGQLDIVQGSVPWPYVFTDLLPLAGYAAAVLWLVRRRRIATVTPQSSSGIEVSQPSQESGSQFGTPSTAR